MNARKRDNSASDSGDCYSWMMLTDDDVISSAVYMLISTRGV